MSTLNHHIDAGETEGNPILFFDPDSVTPMKEFHQKLLTDFCLLLSGEVMMGMLVMIYAAQVMDPQRSEVACYVKFFQESGT